MTTKEAAEIISKSEAACRIWAWRNGVQKQGRDYVWSDEDIETCKKNRAGNPNFKKTISAQ